MLASAEAQIRTLLEKLAAAERSWTALSDRVNAQQRRIEALERGASPGAVSEPAGPAAGTCSGKALEHNGERPSSSRSNLRPVRDETLASEAVVEAALDAPRPPSLLDDLVLFGDDTGPDDHRETVADIDERELGEDSILAQLAVQQPLHSLPDRAFVALDLEDPSGGVVYPLERPLMTIGRSKLSDIRIRSLAVSRTHARLRDDNGRVVIEDAGSKNGITVNSRVVEHAVLSNGDIVTVGGHFDFRFVEREHARH